MKLLDLDKLIRRVQTNKANNTRAYNKLKKKHEKEDTTIKKDLKYLARPNYNEI